MNEEQNFVEIYDEDGQLIKCEIYDVVDFEEKTYALLLPLEDSEKNGDKDVIVMEYIEDGDEGYFKNIEDDNEFQKVCEYIESLDDEEYKEE